MEYDGKESLTKYLRRVELFKLQLQENKYKLLLEFINKWLNTKYKSLTEFANISEEALLSDTKHNRDILRQYSEKIIKELNIKPNNVDEETDSEEIKDKHIIYFLSHALSAIDYKLSNKSFKNVTYYTIRLT
jgi:hypothetical protein